MRACYFTREKMFVFFFFRLLNVGYGIGSEGLESPPPASGKDIASKTTVDPHLRFHSPLIFLLISHFRLCYIFF